MRDLNPSLFESERTASSRSDPSDRSPLAREVGEARERAEAMIVVSFAIGFVTSAFGWTLFLLPSTLSIGRLLLIAGGLGLGVAIQVARAREGAAIWRWGNEWIVWLWRGGSPGVRAAVLGYALPTIVAIFALLVQALR